MRTRSFVKSLLNIAKKGKDNATSETRKNVLNDDETRKTRTNVRNDDATSIASTNIDDEARESIEVFDATSNSSTNDESSNDDTDDAKGGAQCNSSTNDESSNDDTDDAKNTQCIDVEALQYLKYVKKDIVNNSSLIRQCHSVSCSVRSYKGRISGVVQDFVRRPGSLCMVETRTGRPEKNKVDRAASHITDDPLGRSRYKRTLKEGTVVDKLLRHTGQTAI